jgi:gluconokinase
LVEGIAFRFRSLQEALIDVGVQVRQIIASGGFTKSQLWLQVMADALNRELSVPVWGETSALGAALWALLGAGRVDTLEKLGEFVGFGRSCRPNQESVDIYDRIYPVYMKLYHHLGEAFEEVAELQRGLEKQPP